MKWVVCGKQESRWMKHLQVWSLNMAMDMGTAAFLGGGILLRT